MWTHFKVTLQFVSKGGVNEGPKRKSKSYAKESEDSSAILKNSEVGDIIKLLLFLFILWTHQIGCLFFSYWALRVALYLVVVDVKWLVVNVGHLDLKDFYWLVLEFDKVKQTLLEYSEYQE